MMHGREKSDSSNRYRRSRRTKPGGGQRSWWRDGRRRWGTRADKATNVPVRDAGTGRHEWEATGTSARIVSLVPALTELLKDKSNEVREAAKEALKKIKAEK